MMELSNSDNPEDGQEARRPRVQSVSRAASILMRIASTDEGMSPKRLAGDLRLPVQTVYHLLHTLTEVGFVARNQQNLYVLGLSFGTLAQAFSRQLAPPEHLAPLLRSIARETGETAYVAGWWNGEITALGVARGTNPVQVAEVAHGFAQDAHARGSGKLLLAYASAAVRDGYLESHALNRRTNQTLTTREALEEEFQHIRRQGHAVDREEFVEGLSCVAVPLDAGRSPYTLGLSAPTERFKQHFDQYLDVLLRAARMASAPLRSTRSG